MKIAIVGTGYVGLVSGTCFSEFGFDVTCIDQDATRIETLSQGQVPFFEPGLESLMAQCRKNQRLHFTTDLEQGIKTADVVFIAVGTPSLRGDGHADLSYVYQASEQIAKVLSGYTVVVTKSTVPVGTSRKVSEIIRKANPKADFDVASNPEFLREGAAVNDFMRPDRVVVGCESERAQEVLRHIYRPLYLIETPLVFTGIETAELIKYAANSFLATKIAFINEMADICEQVNADIQDVAKAIGLDGRIGRKFLHAGPGFGGSCFPKDILALTRTAESVGAPTRIVEAVLMSNNRRKDLMSQRILDIIGPTYQGKTVAVLGVTFKPNTDDMRDAVSLTLIPHLQERGITVQAYDPIGMIKAEALLSNITWCEDPYKAASNADCVVLLTEWNEFRALDLERLRQVVAQPIFLDLRNVYRSNDLGAAGFDYYSIGRPFVQAQPDQLKAVAVA